MIEQIQMFREKIENRERERENAFPFSTWLHAKCSESPFGVVLRAEQTIKQ